MYDANLTLKASIGSGKDVDPSNMGMYRVAMYGARGEFVENQNKVPGTMYCRLVPLILQAFRKFHNIPYSSWNRENIASIVPKDLAEAMTCDMPEISVEEALAARAYGLKFIKDPTKAPRNPLTTSKLWGLSDPKIKQIPELARVMVCQIWVAHPSNRNNFMILDPTDWDAMPKPLIDTEVLVPKAKMFSNRSIDPWEV